MEEEFVDQGKGDVFIDSMARVGLIKNVTFEQKLKNGMRASNLYIWKKACQVEKITSREALNQNPGWNIGVTSRWSVCLEWS